MKRISCLAFLGLLILLAGGACNHEGIQARDSDSDGLTDAEEATLYGTDPQNPDTDGDGILDGAEGFLTFRINNQVGSSASICPVNANGTVTIFAPAGSIPAGQIDIPAGMSPAYRLNLAAVGGLGIQVNLWYWDREPSIPIQQGPPQNPDNSGDQFIFSANCEFTSQDAYFGKGRKTSRIADVSSRMDQGVCVITIAPNGYTGCVTQRCCAPPLPGWDNACQKEDYNKSVCIPP